LGEFVLSLLSIHQHTRRHVPEETTTLESARFTFGAECVEPYSKPFAHFYDVILTRDVPSVINVVNTVALAGGDGEGSVSVRQICGVRCGDKR